MAKPRMHGTHPWGTILGWLAQVLSLAALAYMTWRVVDMQQYRIDIDVYRMGARAWLDDQPLYGGVRFDIPAGDSLAFTYPPFAAIVFTPFAWLTLPAATNGLTVATVLMLVLSLAIVLSALDVGWSKWCLSAAIVATAIWVEMEPIWATFGHGQINAILMALVIADCLPRRTWWPRGFLVGLAMAVKLTPAVFLLYFLLRRDRWAAVTAVTTFVVATSAAFALAPADSWEYWTRTVHDVNRVGVATMETNQNLAGALARLHVGMVASLTIWALGGTALLVLTVWATRRALSAGESVLALMCVGLFGLVVSPVSWSHHWVWVLPTLVATAIVGYRRRDVPLLVVAAIGLELVTPVLFQQFFGDDPHLWFRWLGVPYVYWALAVIAVVGASAKPASVERARADRENATGLPTQPVWWRQRSAHSNDRRSMPRR